MHEEKAYIETNAGEIIPFFWGKKNKIFQNIPKQKGGHFTKRGGFYHPFFFSVARFFLKIRKEQEQKVKE